MGRLKGWLGKLAVLGVFLASGSLVADIPFFWLDRPQSRSNPHDPKSHLYLQPTPLPIAPVGTPTFTPTASPSLTPASFPTDSPTVTASPTQTFSPTSSPDYSATPTPTPTPSATASPAFSPTATPTPGAADTATPTASPTPDCPLLPYAGLTRDWYTGTGASWQQTPHGFGAAWDNAIITTSGDHPRTSGNHLVVRLDWTGYSGIQGYNWAGWYEPNAAPPYQRKVDLDQYDTLEFWIRGAAGGEDGIAVRFMDAQGTPAASGTVSVTGILGGPLTTAYQKVVIPLCRFDTTGLDRGQVWEIDFLAEGVATESGTMTFYVDDGQFVKYQASPPTPTASPTPTNTPGCVAPSGSPVNEVAWWSGMPPMTQVWGNDPCCRFYVTQSGASPRSPGGLHMVWDVTLSGWWAGGGLNWTNWDPGVAVDGDQFDTFEFWVRGAAGGEPLTLSMAFLGEDGGADVATPMLDLAPYMGPLTASYQLVKVPLCAFNWAGVAKDKLWTVNFSFGGAEAGSHVLYVDEGFFRKY